MIQEDGRDTGASTSFTLLSAKCSVHCFVDFKRDDQYIRKTTPSLLLWFVQGIVGRLKLRKSRHLCIQLYCKVNILEITTKLIYFVVFEIIFGPLLMYYVDKTPN